MGACGPWDWDGAGEGLTGPFICDTAEEIWVFRTESDDVMNEVV